MRKIAGFCLCSSFIAVLCLQTTSCSKNSTTQPDAQTDSNDPAQANLAPVSQQQAQYPQPAQVSPPAQQASYPDQASYPEQDTSYPEDSDDSGSPVYAEQPPPPLPEYNQPQCPGPNYMWTPGNWDYTSAGYYWVPGVWVMAPFVGALWTPPYWGFENNRYRRHQGYWGSHIGFYGGINYGFGYVGRGYEGGYWDRGHFAYNRTVNNINVNVVTNVYNYRVINITNVRTSYVGGRGGLNVRPTAAEVAVMHERRIAPVPAQVQYIRQAADNRSQFANVNHGRPQVAAAPQPLQTSYRAPATRSVEVPGARVLPAAAQPAARQPMRAEPMRAETPRPEAARPESRPEPAAREAQPSREARPESRPSPPQPRAEQRTPPERQPTRPAQEARPAEQQKPAQQARPEPQRREETPRPEQAKPAPRAEPKPEPKKEEKREEQRPPLA